MRLVSKFKDYYDSLQDPTEKRIVYVRQTMELEENDPVSQELRMYRVGMSAHWSWRAERRLGQDQADNVARAWNNHIVPKYLPPERITRSGKPEYGQYSSVVVLFCGKLYRGIRYQEDWDSNGHMPPAVSKVYWDRSSFESDHVVALPGNKDEPEKSAKSILDATFQEPLTNDRLMDLHFMTRCPVFTIRRSDQYGTNHNKLIGVMNPCLKDLQFIRVMDPTIMFQELSMFLGGVLSNNDKTDPVDDRYKIVAHGFDLKESFRKGPTKEHR